MAEFIVMKRKSVPARLVATQVPIIGAIIRFFVAAEPCRVGDDYTSYVKLWFK